MPNIGQICEIDPVRMKYAHAKTTAPVAMIVPGIQLVSSNFGTIIRASVSLAIIFGVVPLLTSAWNPLIAPHAMVMKTNGNNLPGMIGPPPAAYFEIAGA